MFKIIDVACTEPYSGYRARFLSAILWLAATYVLGDVYSAQLTSQLARPAREAPICKSILFLYILHIHVTCIYTTSTLFIDNN